MKGYKVFNSNWTCKDFKYEVGQTYEMDESPICCQKGFHFCEKMSDCFDYYSFDCDNKVAEIEALGKIVKEGNKSCTNKIHIVKELTWEEVLRLCNSGNWNSGNWNSGNWNSGNWNSGDWNSTSYSNGVFNSSQSTILMFNKPTGWTYQDWLNSRARALLNGIPHNVVEWICERDMTDEEKVQNPTYKTTGGYLKILNESDCAQLWWDELPEEDRKIIKALPNFDKAIFEEITGIEMEE